MTNCEVFPNAFRVHRTRLGVSQFELAKRAGLHPATVSLAERGARVSFQTLRKLSAALGVAPQELQP